MPIETMDYAPAKLYMQTDAEPARSWEYRIHACAKEPWTVAFIEAAEPGGVFWDVGACVGSYTLVALAHGMRGVAVEPHHANYDRLCRNLALNNMLGGPLVLCGAVGRKTGFERIQYADMRQGTAQHLVGEGPVVGGHRQYVPIYRLDDLSAACGLAGPHYLKVDVDGGEVA